MYVCPQLKKLPEKTHLFCLTYLCAIILKNNFNVMQKNNINLSKLNRIVTAQVV